MTVVELARSGPAAQATLDELTIDGLAHLEAMAEHGRALVLTAHLGNWEYLALPPADGLSRPASSGRSTPRRSTSSPRQSATEDGGRADRQAGGPPPGATALRRGGLVGILLDQNATRREGVFVPFFGRPASTSRSLALLALRPRTPIVPIFIYRGESGSTSTGS